MLSFLGIGIYDRDKSDVILLCNLEVHLVKIFVMHQSIPNANIPSPVKPPGNVLR